MKCLVYSLLVLGFSFITSSVDAATLPDKVTEKITKIVKKHYPQAKIEDTEKRFLVTFGKMQLNPNGGAGDKAPALPLKANGPQYNAFLFVLASVDSLRRNNSFQTTRGTHVGESYFDRPIAADGSNLLVTFQYGARVEPQFLAEVITALPQTFPQQPSKGLSDSPDNINAKNEVAGIWRLSGETILAHTMKECGIKEIDSETKTKALKLAETLGSRYPLIINGQGGWRLHAILDGAMDSKEYELFTLLVGDKCTEKFYYEHYFQLHDKQSRSGSWEVEKGEIFFEGYSKAVGLKNPKRVGSGQFSRDGKRLKMKDAVLDSTFEFDYLSPFADGGQPKLR